MLFPLLFMLQILFIVFFPTVTVLAVIKLPHYRSSKKKTVSWISVTFLLVTKKVLMPRNMISDCKERKIFRRKIGQSNHNSFFGHVLRLFKDLGELGKYYKHLLYVCRRLQQCTRHFQSKIVVMLEWEKRNHCWLAEKIIAFSINLSYCLHIVIREMIGTNPYSYRSITRLTLTPTGQLRNSSHK